MNILMVHNKYAQYGGEDSIVEHQINLFESKGHNVIKYIKDNNDIPTYDLFDKIKLLTNAYKNKIVEQEIHEIIKKYKPDVAHIHNIYPLISPIIYDVLHAQNIPIVQTLHNYRFICPNGLMYNSTGICEKCLITNNLYSCFVHKCYRGSYVQSLWYADLINRADKRGSFNKINKFIALNPFMKEMMVKKGFESSNIEIIPNFISTDKSLKLNSKGDYYVFIGRLSIEKGILSLLHTLKERPNLKLKILGDGPQRNEVVEFVENNNLKNIELLGFVKGEQKEEILSRAKAVIVPSEWYENFPTVVLEALSLGTISIVNKIGGLQYMVENKKNGLIYEGDLLEKLDYLESQSDSLINMSQSAIETYMENYAPEVYYHKIINLFENLYQNNEV